MPVSIGQVTLKLVKNLNYLITISLSSNLCSMTYFQKKCELSSVILNFQNCRRKPLYRSSGFLTIYLNIKISK